MDCGLECKEEIYTKTQNTDMFEINTLTINNEMESNLDQILYEKPLRRFGFKGMGQDYK